MLNVCINTYMELIVMILTYKDCIEKYGSDHLLKKEIAEGRLFQKEKGIYSLLLSFYPFENGVDSLFEICETHLDRHVGFDGLDLFFRAFEVFC